MRGKKEINDGTGWMDGGQRESSQEGIAASFYDHVFMLYK